MEVIVVRRAQDVGVAAAGVISRLVAAKPGAVLGLATGASVERVYAELVLAHSNQRWISHGSPRSISTNTWA
jgi:glucosamine-6-phosphate deaminase